MDLVFLLLLICAAGGVAVYFVVKWILILLIAPLLPEEEARDDVDSSGARDITIRIEITGLPKPAEEAQDQPQPSTAARGATPRFRLPKPAETDQDRSQTPSTSG